MMTIMPPSLFVTGTDTGIGKTHVTCLIARHMRAAGLRVAAYKPACSGAIFPVGRSTNENEPRWDDIERLSAATDGEWSDEIICPQRFLAPLAPPAAARREGKSVDFSLLVEGAQRFAGAQIVLVEGAGGWLSPVTDHHTVADLAVALKTSVLVVAKAGLGTINHTLLTVEAIRSRRLPIAGIVLNMHLPPGDDESYLTNADEIEARSGCSVLGMVPYGNMLELHRSGLPVTIDWFRLIQTANTTRDISAEADAPS